MVKDQVIATLSLKEKQFIDRKFTSDNTIIKQIYTLLIALEELLAVAHKNRNYFM